MEFPEEESLYVPFLPQQYIPVTAFPPQPFIYNDMQWYLQPAVQPLPLPDYPFVSFGGQQPFPQEGFTEPVPNNAPQPSQQQANARGRKKKQRRNTRPRNLMSPSNWPSLPNAGTSAPLPPANWRKDPKQENADVVELADDLVERLFVGEKKPDEEKEPGDNK